MNGYRYRQTDAGQTDAGLQDDQHQNMTLRCFQEATYPCEEFDLAAQVSYEDLT